MRVVAVRREALICPKRADQWHRTGGRLGWADDGDGGMLVIATAACFRKVRVARRCHRRLYAAVGSGIARKCGGGWDIARVCPKRADPWHQTWRAWH